MDWLIKITLLIATLRLKTWAWKTKALVMFSSHSNTIMEFSLDLVSHDHCMFHNWKKLKALFFVKSPPVNTNHLLCRYKIITAFGFYNNVSDWSFMKYMLFLLTRELILMVEMLPLNPKTNLKKLLVFYFFSFFFSPSFSLHIFKLLMFYQESWNASEYEVL